GPATRTGSTPSPWCGRKGSRPASSTSRTRGGREPGSLARLLLQHLTDAGHAAAPFDERTSQASQQLARRLLGHAAEPPDLLHRDAQRERQLLFRAHE